MHHPHKPVLSVLLAAVALCGLRTPAAAIDIDGTQPAAVDLPSINALLQPLAGGKPYVFDIGFGIALFNIPAYLDTGTSGIVISSNTAGLWEVPIQVGTVFSDVGIGGSTDYNVTIPLNVRAATSNTLDTDNLATYQTVYNQVYNNIRIQAGPFNPPPDPILGSPDVFGMPLMMGKTTVLDVRAMNAGTDFLRTYIFDQGTPFDQANIDTNPGIPSTSHHVKLSYGDFARFTQVTPAGADGPAFAHNPLIGPNPLATEPDPTPPVTFGFQGRQATGTLLFDSGAQISMISTALAESMNVRYTPGTFGTANPQLETFDPAHPEAPGTPIPGQFFIPVQGLGGSITAAGFRLDELVLQTLEGSGSLLDPNDIRFLNAPVLVNDVSAEDPITHEIFTLDGLFGMNLLLASQSVTFDDTGFPIFGPEISGAFNWVKFDEPAGLLGLDFIGEVPEPDTLVLAASGLLLLAAYARRRRAAK